MRSFSLKVFSIFIAQPVTLESSGKKIAPEISFEEFIALSGDRFYGEDKSVITGFAKFDGKSVLVIGQDKGDDLETRIEKNFGMMSMMKIMVDIIQW
mgnify:CR=1 FL=1